MATDGFVKWIDGPSYAAIDERRLASVEQVPDGVNPFGARSGRRIGPGLAVSIAGSPEAWTVTPGAGRIFDSANPSEGAYDFEIPASKSANLPGRPSAGQSRTDYLVARVYTTGTDYVKIEHVAGTAGVTPAAPTLPARSVRLATLTVPASGTITIAPSVQVAVSAGGILPVGTTAERDALTAYAGLTVYNNQTAGLEVYNGSAWIALDSSLTVVSERYVNYDQNPPTLVPEYAPLVLNGDNITRGITWDATNNIWTVVKPGLYAMEGNLTWSAEEASHYLQLEINGTRIRRAGNGLTAGSMYQHLSLKASLVAGDTVQFLAYQGTGGGTLLGSATFQTTYANITRIGA